MLLRVHSFEHKGFEGMAFQWVSVRAKDLTSYTYCRGVYMLYVLYMLYMLYTYMLKLYSINDNIY